MNFDKISWYILNKCEDALEYSEIDFYYSDDNTQRNLVEKYQQMYGVGPHDILGKVIKVGDRVAVALSGEKGKLAVGTVKEVIDMKIKVKLEAHSDYCNPDIIDTVKTYKDTERVIIL